MGRAAGGRAGSAILAAGAAGGAAAAGVRAPAPRHGARRPAEAEARGPAAVGRGRRRALCVGDAACGSLALGGARGTAGGPQRADRFAVAPAPRARRRLGAARGRAARARRQPARAAGSPEVRGRGARAARQGHQGAACLLLAQAAGAAEVRALGCFPGRGVALLYFLAGRGCCRRLLRRPLSPSRAATQPGGRGAPAGTGRRRRRARRAPPCGRARAGGGAAPRRGGGAGEGAADAGRAAAAAWQRTFRTSLIRRGSRVRPSGSDSRVGLGKCAGRPAPGLHAAGRESTVCARAGHAGWLPQRGVA
jgi:hypothetical protein